MIRATRTYVQDVPDPDDPMTVSRSVIRLIIVPRDPFPLEAVLELLQSGDTSFDTPTDDVTLTVLVPSLDDEFYKGPLELKGRFPELHVRDVDVDIVFELPAEADQPAHRVRVPDAPLPHELIIATRRTGRVSFPAVFEIPIVE